MDNQPETRPTAPPQTPEEQLAVLRGMIEKQGMIYDRMIISYVGQGESLIGEVVGKLHDGAVVGKLLVLKKTTRMFLGSAVTQDGRRIEVPRTADLSWAQGSVEHIPMLGAQISRLPTLTQLSIWGHHQAAMQVLQQVAAQEAAANEAIERAKSRILVPRN